MNPDRAASIFRELLQTPESELGHLPRRMGLQGHPTPPDLQQAKELLDALIVALQSGPGPNWERVNTAWEAMVAKHGKLGKSAMGYAQPAWIRDLPPKPTLGDPAPGSSGHTAAEDQRQRYVPPAPGDHGGHQAGYPPPGRYVPPAGYAPPNFQGQPQAHAPQGHAQQAHQQQQQAHQQQQQQQQQQQAHQPQRAAAPPQPPQPPPPPQRSAAPAPAAQAPAAQAPAAQAPAAQAPAAQAPEGDIRNSVAKYAAFCAACAAHPNRVFMTQVEYGITSPEARTALDDDWQNRFDDDAELHAKWEQLFRQFRERLG